MSGETILIADDDGAIRTVLNRALARAGYLVRTTGNAATLWRWIAQGDGDIVLTDVVLPDENAFNLLPRIKKHRPDLPILVMSAQNTLKTAITAAEQGAYDYLPKPFDLNELINVVGRALATPQGTPEGERTRKSDHNLGEDNLPLIGRSNAMQEIYRVMARLIQTDLTVMITGESGTGKELVARALHDYGRRQNDPFVAVNMAAIPRELIESELFGHEKGAFTGAAERAVGKFEQANGGTLFLDEIGDMPMEAQTRLLRVLQEGEYTRIGGRALIKADVRIIAATNRDLRRQVHQGLFREDLFYRLNVVPMNLPPLRDRLDDIPDLTRHFLKLAEEEGLPVKQIEPRAIDALKLYNWPGNIRELENLVRRLAALYAQETITADLITAELSQGDMQTSLQMHEDRNLSELAERHISDYFASFGDGLPPPGVYSEFLKQIERPLITITLGACGGNQLKAASILGLNRNTLRKKITELDIKFSRRMR